MWSPYLVNYKIVYQPHPLMNLEGCQHLYIWLDLMVYDMPSKTEAKSVPVIIYLPMTHPWSVPHPCTHWWTERCVNTCMYTWGLWYITHHPRQRLKVCYFSSISSNHMGSRIHFLWEFLRISPLFPNVGNRAVPHRFPKQGAPEGNAPLYHSPMSPCAC